VAYVGPLGVLYAMLPLGYTLGHDISIMFKMRIEWMFIFVIRSMSCISFGLCPPCDEQWCAFKWCRWVGKEYFTSFNEVESSNPNFKSSNPHIEHYSPQTKPFTHLSKPFNPLFKPYNPLVEPSNTSFQPYNPLVEHFNTSCQPSNPPAETSNPYTSLQLMFLTIN